ncbi:MAG: ABC transporter ATP-binding protein/permease [Lentisphaeria bacterium]|nr:ABC transporter ATP-binding protein/permease [Lentisphaeria bacterium]
MPEVKQTHSQRLVAYIKPYWHWVGLAVIANILVSAIMVLRPYLTKRGIDDGIIPKDISTLQFFAIAFLGCIILQSIIQYGLSYMMAYIGQKVIYDIRVKLFKKSTKMDLKFYDQNPVGQLVTRVTNDIDALNEMFSSGIIMIISNILVIIFIIVMMFIMNVKLALVALMIVPPIVVVSFFFRIKVRQAFDDVRTYLASLNSFMQEHISGMSVVQIFNREKEEFNKFTGINSKLKEAHRKTVFYFAMYFPTVEFLSSVTFGCLIYFGGGDVVQEKIKLGELIMFIQYVEMFFRPIYDLSDKYNILQSALAASTRIFKLMDEPANITAPKTTMGTPRNDSCIEFKDVSFAYVEGTEVIKNLNLNICKGETIAIVGSTGAGKTTIINLLSRFYEVNKGEILIDGLPIKNYSFKDLRERMSLVLQDIFLFPGSILENIQLYNGEVTREDVIAACKLTGIHEFISQQPNGYDTEIQEGGGNLSVGQKQLIAFARAMVAQPELLVLDEATSSIDTEAEQLIQEATIKLMENRTSIVIAHRLSTIQHANRIAVMHKGELKEIGTRQELLDKKGLYYRLHKLQYQSIA